MKMTYLIGMFVFLLLIMTTNMKDQGYELYEVLNTTSQLENHLVQLPKNFEYTNPFQENFTFEQGVYNFIHAMMYSILIQTLTIIGATIQWSWDFVSLEILLSILRSFLIICFLWIGVKLFVPFIATYILVGDFYKEKKNIELKWYWKVFVTMCIWSFIIGLIVLLVLFGV
jgi:hypothetical protein